MAFGVALGVAFGVAAIVGFTRALNALLYGMMLLCVRSLCWLRLLSSVTCIRRSPAQFDELIYFPLPFYHSLLLEAADVDRPLVLDTIEKMQTSPGLRNTARSVLLELTCRPLERLERLSELSEHLSRLPDLRALLPTVAPLVSETLPELANHLALSRLTTLPARRLELLRESQGELERLKSTVLLSPDADVKRFLPVVQHWTSLLNVDLAQAEADEARYQGSIKPSGSPTWSRPLATVWPIV